MKSIIPPKKPGAGTSRAWVQLPTPPEFGAYGYEAIAFRNVSAGINVISAVEVAKDADGIDRGPEFHVSISKDGRKRCSSSEAREVLRVFDMGGAEEDNHVPGGFVRNFWRPVADRFVGLECACKESEPAIREDKGDFVWRPAE